MKCNACKFSNMHQIPINAIPFICCFVSVVEKDLNFGDHGYARRTPLPGLEGEDADGTGEDQQPCTQCQLLKKQLEQEMQHTARLQKEVGGCCVSVRHFRRFKSG